MTIAADIAEFSRLLPARGALLGLDLGTKTIGVAICDAGWRIASPLVLIERKKFGKDAEALFKIAAEKKATGLIIGLPLNMDGSEGPRAQATRAFARNLERLTPLVIGFWDERLSTFAVERTLIEADRSRARRAELIDKMAAGYILQGAIDRLGRL